MRRDLYAPYFLLSAAVVIADQFTKYLVQSRFVLFESVKILPFFSIVYVSNTGSAFGMFKGLGNVFFIAVAGAATLVVAALIIKYRQDRFAFALILGGAAGNLLDRLTHGFVVDFIDVFWGEHHWPAFNVADSALTVGITLLFFGTFFRSKNS